MSGFGAHAGTNAVTNNSLKNVGVEDVLPDESVLDVWSFLLRGLWEMVLIYALLWLVYQQVFGNLWTTLTKYLDNEDYLYRKHECC